MKRAILLVALVMSASGAAAPVPDMELQKANHEYLAINIDNLSKDANNIGLTKDRIRDRVESRLESVGLKSVETDGETPFLDVTMTVMSEAFSIDISYLTPASFEMRGGRRFYYFTDAWQDGFTGAHGRNASYVIDWLDEILGRFLSQYLEANQK
ncbi:MAG: hypothetical protein R3268_02225 [Acidiferrobacterales bacterium]|nr:hypothetical protein [Acidiferrobacterales bacterium]